MSRLIHDTVIQGLSLSKIKLGAMREDLVKTRRKQDRDRLDFVRGLIEESIQQCRSLMSDLAPPMLYELGLEVALDDMVECLRKRHGATITLECDASPKPMGRALRGLLFQSVRELLMNALKYAGQCRIAVSTRRDGDRVYVRVADDGAGFDPTKERDPKRAAEGGFGLFSIRERVVGLGGRFDIQSEPGKGTAATIVMPLTAEDRASTGSID